jgi:hypothetical protein
MKSSMTKIVTHWDDYYICEDSTPILIGTSYDR